MTDEGSSIAKFKPRRLMKSLIRAFAVAILCAAVAGAAEKGRKKSSGKAGEDDPAKKSFRLSDANRDGCVNLSEWKAGGKADAAFKAKDKNKDGKLTFDEFKAEAPAGAVEVKKYDRKSADQHLRRLKKLQEDGLLTKEMYDRKVAETEANIEEAPAPSTPAAKK